MKRNIFIIITISSALLLLSSCKEIDKLVEKVKEEATDGYFIDQPSETFSKPSDSATVLPKNPDACPNWASNSVVDLSESITLPKGCNYSRVQIKISNKSDITLDCNGAELNSLYTKYRQDIEIPYSAKRAPLKYGIHIATSETSQSRNIIIKNCKLRNYVRGISISYSVGSNSSTALKNGNNIVDVENYLRERAPKNIKVENSEISYSHNVGIFLGRYITSFVLKNTTIKNSASAGLYLDSGSQKNIIENSRFINNGHSQYNESKRVRVRRQLTTAREGIAIDSSAINTIKNNLFTKNAGGSIFIYKNCNEHHKTQTPRYQPADNNLITGNSFKDEDVAVWVASRQSKDLKRWDCGSPLMDTGTVKYGPKKVDTKIYEDFAKNNQIVNNTFFDVSHGIIVEDDNTKITGNNFKGSASYDIKIGTRYRTRSKSHPVTDTIIKNNTFNSDASDPIEINYDSVGTIIKGNTPSQLNN